MGKFFHNDFQKGHVDEYEVQGEDVGDLLMITLHNSGGGFFSDWFGFSDWFVNKVNISKTPNTSHRVYSFPCFRWVTTELVVFEGKGMEPSIYLSIYLPGNQPN